MAACGCGSFSTKGDQASFPATRENVLHEARLKPRPNRKHAKSKRRVSLKDSLIAVVGDFKQRRGDKIKGHRRVSVAAVVEILLGLGHPDYSALLPEWGTSKWVAGYGVKPSYPKVLSRIRPTSSLLASSKVTKNGSLVRRTTCHNVISMRSNVSQIG